MVVLVNGCFDGLHAGHRRFLAEATRFGDPLVVLNDDDSVKALKGRKRPIQPIVERASGIHRMGFRWAIFDGNSDALVRCVKPDIIVRGWDQQVSAEDRKHIVVILPRYGNHSTSCLAQKHRS